MESAAHALGHAHQLYARADNPPAPNDERPPAFKAIGIGLAVGSGAFIGVSFVLKKFGLLRANEKYNEVAGEGYGYLKNLYWWGGMILMIIGEILNFAAYAFTDAILVTPLGALSVVITAVLSAIFLKERLSMVGKVACFLCIVGSVVIVMNAPHSSSVKNIEQMQDFVIQPAFLTYAGVVIVGSVIVAFWLGPKYGNKNMLVYISICSWVGGLSVVATQGLGAAIIAQANGVPQFNQWFLYVLLVFVIGTLLTEIIFLNVRDSIRIRLALFANWVAESAQSVQRRVGDAYILCLLHQHDNYQLGHFVPGLHGDTVIHRHRGLWVPDYPLRRRLAPPVQIGKGCSRRSRFGRRPGSEPHHC
jgi:drug/metabolite transporter (DMT)-like permease